MLIETQIGIVYDEQLVKMTNNSEPNFISLPAVHIKDLRKVFVVNQQETGAKAVVRGLVRRRKIAVPAGRWHLFRSSPGGNRGFSGFRMAPERLPL